LTRTAKERKRGRDGRRGVCVERKERKERRGERASEREKVVGGYGRGKNNGNRQIRANNR
jgi:hypothetical protein